MSKEKLYFIGNTVFYISLLFNLLETWHFGWNVTPSGPNEIICDYISKFGFFIGVSIMVYAAFIRFWEV